MMINGNVIDLAGQDENLDLLTEMLRVDAQQLIQQKVQAELQELARPKPSASR